MLQIYLHPFQLKPGHFTVEAEATGGISEWDFQFLNTRTIVRHTAKIVTV